METRTLYCLLAAGIMLAAGTAIAEGTPEKPAEAPFMIKLSPAEQAAPGGASVTYQLLAQARTNVTLHISVRSEALNVTPSASDLVLTPGAAPASLALSLVAPAQRAPNGPYTFVVTAKDDDGHAREIRGALAIRIEGEKAPAKPQPERPQEKPRGDDISSERREINADRRLDAIMERLDRLERLLARLEQGAPHDPPADEMRPVVRMMLADPRAQVPAEGGRIALLFEGGERDARVRLAPEFNATSGWNVTLEHEVVFVPAHERAWSWVFVHPGETPSLEYRIVQLRTPGPYAATGVVSARTA